MKNKIKILLILMCLFLLNGCGNFESKILDKHSWGETKNKTKSIGDTESLFGIDVLGVNYYYGNDGLCEVCYSFKATNENATMLANQLTKQYKNFTIEKTEDEKEWHSNFYVGTFEYTFYYKEDFALSIRIGNDKYDN